MSRIGSVIAVTSCKGGVGKSTVSFGLAQSLAKRGHRVGLFDADLHGPSLPTQVPADVSARGVVLDEQGWSVKPLEHDGLKLMSFGWLGKLWTSSSSTTTELQGEVDPRGAGSEAGLAVQLLHTTEWGDLDYLLIDTPPGTGDIPRALAARAQLSGAVVVTTPSEMAHVDVLRGLAMLDRFDVPVLAVVENMASFRCSDCGKDHFPFGIGHLDAVLAILAERRPKVVASSFRLPIVAKEHSGNRLDSALDALATSLEQRQHQAATFPQLEWFESPNWPDKLFFAARGATRTIRKNDLTFKIGKPSSATV